jgi:hypothetical protein
MGISFGNPSLKLTIVHEVAALLALVVMQRGNIKET